MFRHALALPIVFLFSISASAFENISRFEQDSYPFKVLLFLSKDCPCSKSHVAHLNELQDKFKTVAFFGVITDEFSEDNKKWIEEYFTNANFKFTIIKDSEQKLIKEYRALKTPHATLLRREPNGKYTRIYEGGVSDHRDFSHSKANFLSENLAAATSGKPLPYNNGKSLGCYIRRI